MILISLLIFRFFFYGFSILKCCAENRLIDFVNHIIIFQVKIKSVCQRKTMSLINTRRQIENSRWQFVRLLFNCFSAWIHACFNTTTCFEKLFNLFEFKWQNSKRAYNHTTCNGKHPVHWYLKFFWKCNVILFLTKSVIFWFFCYHANN